MSEEEEAVEVMMIITEALRSAFNDPCAACGEVGDALPCINCDKLVCGSCGVDTRWCGKKCAKESARLRRLNGPHARGE